MLKHLITYLTENKKFDQNHIKSIVSKLDVDLTPAEYLTSGGTADIYQYNDKIVKFIRESGKHIGEVEQLYSFIEGKKFKNVINIHHFMKVPIKPMLNNKQFIVIIIMENLKPLDEVFTEYNIPSIKQEKSIKRHPFTWIVSIVGDIVLDMIENGDEMYFETIRGKDLYDYAVKNNVSKYGGAKNQINRMGLNEFKQFWDVYSSDSLFIQMWNNIANGIKEIAPYTEYYDLHYDNVMYDPKTKQFKLIDLD